jgi:hypothetical protein
MNLALLFDEIFTVLDAAAIGLNVPTDGHGVRGGPPAPYVELPMITYGEGGPGLDRITDCGLLVVFGPANNPIVFRLALEYASTTGTNSIKAALEAHHWTHCGTLFVRSAEPTMETVTGNNPAIAYTFHIDVTGAP